MTWRALLPGLVVAVLLSGCTSTTSSPTTLPTGRVVAVGPDLSVTVPEGWRVLRTAYPLPGVEPTSLCLVGPGNHQRPCAGVSLTWTYLGGPRGAGTYRPDQPGGWDDGTELATCPVRTSSDSRITLTADPVTGTGQRAVGTHRAAWNRWHATCTDGSTFDPQAWYLPGVEVLVKDLTGHGETARILASVAFRQDGAVIPDEATHLEAWVTAVDGDTFTIRPLRADGRRAGAPREVDVSGAVCTGNVVVPGEVVQPVVACGQFASLLRASQAGRVRSLLWLEADGTVAQVSEQLRS